LERGDVGPKGNESAAAINLKPRFSDLPGTRAFVLRFHLAFPENIIRALP